MPEAAGLSAKLQAEGRKLADFALQLSEAQWNVQVYAEGTVWTVRSILAHLMTSERAFLKLFAAIRDGGPGVSDDFVIDRYNASQQQKTAGLKTAEILGQYRDAREQMVRLVSGFSDADLQKRGRHPFLGVTTLREMIKMIYIHNQTHQRDIRRVLRG
jgi:uncharacterized damage-inducible protein DinB